MHYCQVSYFSPAKELWSKMYFLIFAGSLGCIAEFLHELQIVIKTSTRKVVKGQNHILSPAWKNIPKINVNKFKWNMYIYIYNYYIWFSKKFERVDYYFFLKILSFLFPSQYPTGMNFETQQYSILFVKILCIRYNTYTVFSSVSMDWVNGARVFGLSLSLPALCRPILIMFFNRFDVFVTCASDCDGHRGKDWTCDF